MEHGEITPETIKSTIVKFIKFRNEVVETITEFYGDEILKLSVFFKEISNKYFENEVPMLDIQFEAMRSIFTSILNAWSINVSKTEEVTKNKLDYLRTQCVPRMSSEEFRVLFDFKKDPHWNKNLKEMYSRLLNRSELGLHYKENIRMEIQENYNHHMKIRNKNITGILENSEQTFLDFNEEIVAKKTSNDARENQFDLSFDRNRQEFTAFLELKRTAFIHFFESSVQTCKMAIDLSIEGKTTGSSYFVRDFKESVFSQISCLEKSSRTYLERLSGKVARWQDQSSKTFAHDNESHFANEMDFNLEKIIESMKSQLNSKADYLNEYRKGEREEIRKLYHEDLTNNEKHVLHATDTKLLNIELSEFEQTKEEIGRGGEGRVFRYLIPGYLIGFNSSLVNIAVKKFEIISPQSSNKTSSSGVTGNEEVLALFKLRHPNIVQFIGTGTLDGERHLILEYCPKFLAGAIDDCRTSNNFIIPTDFTNWASGIANGLRYVHENRHYHGDLKPSNILIDSNGVAKLADFGLSAIPISRRCTISSRNRGTARYMAPEQHTGEQLDLEGLKRCDVWAFGIVLWEMVTCRKPLSCIQDHAIALVIGAKDENSHPALPNECSCEYLVNLLRRCWCSKAIERPSSYSIATVFMRNLIFDFEDVFNHGDQWKEECEMWARASEE